MRAAEVLVIVGDTEGVLVVNEAIDLSKANVLVKTARERTSCHLNLSGQAGIVGKEIRRETIYGGAVIDGQWLVTDLAFIISEIEQTIVDERSTNGTAKLLPPIVRFGNPLLLVDLVVGAGGGVEDVIVGVAVDLVGATLGDGIYQAASGLAELRLESGTGDLEFTDYVFAKLEGNGASDLLGKKGVVVVAAIDRVIVEVSRDSVEADHAEIAVSGGSWSEQGKVSKVATVKRQRFDALLIHDGAER